MKKILIASILAGLAVAANASITEIGASHKLKPIPAFSDLELDRILKKIPPKDWTIYKHKQLTVLANKMSSMPDETWISFLKRVGLEQPVNVTIDWNKKSVWLRPTDAQVAMAAQMEKNKVNSDNSQAPTAKLTSDVANQKSVLDSPLVTPTITKVAELPTKTTAPVTPIVTALPRPVITKTPAMVWAINKEDGRLSVALNNWAKTAGYSAVDWSAKSDYDLTKLANNLEMRGNLFEAVKKLNELLSSSNMGIFVKISQDDKRILVLNQQ